VARLKSAQFDDRMTLVEHLDELRTRIIVSILFLVLAVAFCFWQNHEILEIANEPLPGDLEPLTFSPTEPFFTTLKLSLYGGILIALPLLLYQVYAFVLPAFSPGEKRVVLPMLLMVPVLFVGGTVFAYFVIMPPALDFLLGFNADQFRIEVRASEYYGFFMLTLIGIGLLFQIPIAVLAVTRLGIVTPQQLAKNRKYAILVIAVVAMLLPGTDPITMLIAMAPLYLLFEVSLQLSRLWGNPGDDDAKPADEAG
jgi:sec-independent protein translocase protein TatC